MTGGAGSEPSRRGGEALVFCTAQYKYLLWSEGWEQTGSGVLQQRDGPHGPSGATFPEPGGSSWSSGIAHPFGWGAGSGSPRSSEATEPPGPPPVPRSGHWAARGRVMSWCRDT